MTALFVRLRYVSAVLLVVALAASAPVYVRAQNGGGGGVNGRVAALESAVAQLTAALAAETAARQAAAATLQASLNSEAAARIAADTTLQNNINAASMGAVSQAQLNAEAAARIAADTTLQNNIDNEAAARGAADTTLLNNIDALSAAATVPPVLTALASYLTIDTTTINGLVGPHIIFTGANLHIRNGQGGTYFAGNGVGNLIVGYNSVVVSSVARTGSHNVVIGDAHSYPSMGGLVAGFGNGALGIATSVSGGEFNTAVEQMSSVSGGAGNSAVAMDSTVSGGQNRSTATQFQWVAGGLTQPQ
jgi:hypothetical protein